MPRWIKIALAALAALFALAAIGLVVLVNTIDLNRYARLAVDQVKIATGRDLRIDGKLEVKVFPRLAIVAENVAFGNARWGSRRDMVKIKRLEGAIALLPLLRRQIEVVRLVAIEPDLLLETDAKGFGNWVLGQSPKASASSAADFGVRGVTIDRGVVVYRNGATKQSMRLSLPRVRLTEKFLVAKDDVDIEAVFRDQPFTIKGTIGTLSRVLAKDTAWPMRLTFATAGAEARIDGDIDLSAAPLSFDAMLKAEVTHTAGLAKLAGIAIAAPTPFAISAKLTAANGEQRADPIEIKLAQSAAHGRIAVRTGNARPFISVRLESKELDLTPFARPKETRPPGEARVFSDAPLPLDALRAIDGEADVAIERLILPNKVPLESVSVHAALKSGRLDAQPLQATLGGGAIKGRVSLDASKRQAPTLTVNLEGKGISMEKVANAAGQPGTMAGGAADVAISLSGPGESLHRFAGWSNGDARLVMGPARISGGALDAGGDLLTRVLDAANPSRRKDPYTEMKCAVIRLPIRDGVATSRRSIAYETSKINMAVAGTINLRTEGLDLAIRPSVKEGLGIGVANLAELVRVTGTLSEPSIGIDTLESAKAALSLGGAILTGGLSLLGQALLSLRGDDPQPCQTALGTSQRAQEPTDDGLFAPVRRLFR